MVKLTLFFKNIFWQHLFRINFSTFHLWIKLSLFLSYIFLFIIITNSWLIHLKHDFWTFCIHKFNFMLRVFFVKSFFDVQNAFKQTALTTLYYFPLNLWLSDSFSIVYTRPSECSNYSELLIQLDLQCGHINVYCLSWTNYNSQVKDLGWTITILRGLLLDNSISLGVFLFETLLSTRSSSTAGLVN